MPERVNLDPNLGEASNWATKAFISARPLIQLRLSKVPIPLFC